MPLLAGHHFPDSLLIPFPGTCNAGAYAATQHERQGVAVTGTSTLILGGARSGKSRFAEELAEATPGRRIYIATAEALDAEMEQRIAHHRQQRGSGWQTVECSLALADAISAHAAPDAVVLVDCLTLWLSNLMFAEADIMAECARLADAISGAPGMLLMVSNEVGQGIVPDNALARRFRDEAGRVNQAIARISDAVWFVTAGIPSRLK
jgi:adenosylcobinamide kinase/adenosylcobinamide-phosphate guanylyltransferase